MSDGDGAASPGTRADRVSIASPRPTISRRHGSNGRCTTRRRFALVLQDVLANDGGNQKMSGESATMPFLRVILAAVLLLTGIASSLAQGYPNRPVRVVVGFTPGGPTDVIARLVAQKLSDSLGQQFYVENVAGAGGNLAAGQVAHANFDGYTIMAISTGFMVNPSLYAQVPYDPIKDFSAVTLVAVSPNVVVVNPSVPAKTLPELVQLIRDNPGKYSYAGPGIGSTPHLGGELFRLTYKLDLVHVPFAGAAPAVQSTVGGHTPIAFTALPSSLAAIQGGQVRAIGVAANERADGIPDVPTFVEQGINGQDADTLTGIVAPAGTPKEIVELLSREIARSVARPDFRERLAVLGFKPVANTPDEFAARIKVEIDKWGKVVRDANLRIE
jgi:tripartite-type tricarboxylate transporter receptor subunit TctC